MIKNIFGNKPKEEDIVFVQDYGFAREIAIEALEKTNGVRNKAV